MRSRRYRYVFTCVSGTLWDNFYHKIYPKQNVLFFKWHASNTLMIYVRLEATWSFWIKFQLCTSSEANALTSRFLQAHCDWMNQFNWPMVIITQINIWLDFWVKYHRLSMAAQLIKWSKLITRQSRVKRKRTIQWDSLPYSWHNFQQGQWICCDHGWLQISCSYRMSKNRPVWSQVSNTLRFHGPLWRPL